MAKPPAPRKVQQPATDDTINPFRAGHLSLARRVVATPDGIAEVTFDEAESPLGWLARRKGRDGQPLIQAVQFQAGERLRIDFTRAQLTPTVTSSWDPSRAGGRRGQGGSGTFTDAVVAAREQVRRALDAVGPEFAGLLLDGVLFPQRPCRHRKRTALAAAGRQDRAATRAQSPGASLRFRGGGARTYARTDQGLARSR